MIVPGKKETQPRANRPAGYGLLRWVAAGALTILLFVLPLFPWSEARPQEPIDLFIDFQQYTYGVPPHEFVYAATGPYGPVLSSGRPLWRTYVDLFAPSPKFVMIQASTLAKPEHYPLAVLNKVEAADVRLSVYLKLIDGQLDQSAGLVWRVHDENNYYAVLVSAMADQLLLLAMKQGRTVPIATVPVTIEVEFERHRPSPTWGWYDLQVESRGDQIMVWLQGEKLIETYDTTFPGAGRVGLITHADSVATFDDFYVQSGSGNIARPARPKPSPFAPPVVHVAGLFTTDASFQNPRAVFSRGKHLYWKAAIANRVGEPVPAAVVEIDILRPDGSLLGTEKRSTGSFGTALFAHQIPTAEPAGTYTLRIKTVTHADIAAARYDPAANVISSIIVAVD